MLVLPNRSINLDNIKQAYGARRIVITNDALCADANVFPHAPMVEQDTPYLGNESVHANHIYHAAMLVLLPACASFRLLCATDLA